LNPSFASISKNKKANPARRDWQYDLLPIYA
jgi:hypothetical protein